MRVSQLAVMLGVHFDGDENFLSGMARKVDRYDRHGNKMDSG
jgi:hypothetical protein